jgi:hypothetical protein
MHMVGEAYRSVHTFLTTGENATLGKLEDQLRGRMERVMAPDGDIEWVSVQGRDAWLQKRATVNSTEAPPPQPLPTGGKKATAEFTEEDRQLLQKLKLQMRAPEPTTTTHTVDRGNQMQYTASAFSQQGPQGTQDQLTHKIAELEARLARAEGVVNEHITDTAMQLEDVHGRVDGLAPADAAPGNGGGKGGDGCCIVS